MILRFALLLDIGPFALAARAAGDGNQPEPPPLYIEGYADQLSYQPGDIIRLHVCTAAPKWSLEIARIGAKTEKLLTKSDLAGPVRNPG